MDEVEQDEQTLAELIEQEVKTLLTGLGPPQGPLSSMEAAVVKSEKANLIKHKLISADLIKGFDTAGLIRLKFSGGAASALTKAFPGMCLSLCAWGAAASAYCGPVLSQVVMTQ